MITRLFCSLLLCLSLLFTSCNSDPETAKKKYVDSGNKYYDRGKSKEALIMYRKALQVDAKYGEAYYRSGMAQLKMQRYGEALRSFQRAVELQPKNLEAHVALSDLLIALYTSDPKRPRVALDELKSLADKAAANFPESSQRARLDGYLALFSNDLKLAGVNFEKANRLKANQPDLVLIYMQVLNNEGRGQEAEKLAMDMIHTDPKALTIYDALFVAYVRAKRIEDAEKILKLKLENNPTLPDGYLQLAAHYYSTNRRPEMLAVLNRMTSDSKNFPKGPMLVGDYFLRIRDNDSALASYQEGAKRNDKEKHSYQKRIVEALVRQNKKDEAVRLIAEVLKEDPQDNEALAIRGGLSLLAGTKDEIQNAINDLQAVSTKMPDNAVVRFNLGRALLAKGSVAQGKVQFEEAVKLQPAYIPPRLALAELLLRSSDFSKAVQAAQEILMYDSTNLGGRLIRTRGLIGIGELKQARAELNQTAQQFPNLAEARLQLAALDIAEKNYKGAEDTFRRLYAANQDPRAVTGLVETYMAQRQVDQAAKLLRDELAKSPGRLEYRAMLGNVLLSKNDTEGAIAEYKKVLEGAPKSADIWQRLALAYHRSNNTQSALDSLKKAQESSPNDPSPVVQMAQIYETLGQRTSARPLYQQVLRLQPENPVALNNLAYMMADSGQDLDQALTMAQKAKQQMPKDINVSDTMGWIFIKKNLPDSAISIYKDLVVQDPNRSSFRYHYGVALSQKGDKAAAKREFEAALRNKPGKEDEAHIRELLAKLG